MNSTASLTTQVPLNTPWGYAQDAEQVAPGVWCVSTASHGGYWLNAEARAAMRMKEPALARFKTFAGGPWYEEDCDWAVVALAFPEAFPAEARENALRCLRITRSGNYQQVYQDYVAAHPEAASA